MSCTPVAWVCLLLCKEEGSSPVSAITERRDMSLYEVSMLSFGMGTMMLYSGLQTTQPTRGGAVTAVWQTLRKLCRPLPPPAMGTCFGASRPCGPAGWLAMLLIKASDVETNPGPLPHATSLDLRYLPQTNTS